MKTNVTKAMNAEKALELINASATNGLHEKVETIQGLKVNYKKISFQTSKPLTEMISKYYAGRAVLFSVYESYSNNLKYLSSKYDELDDKDNLSEDEKVEKVRLEYEMKKVSACWRFFRRTQEDLQYPAYNSVTNAMYEAYCDRFDNENAWTNAIKAWFKNFEIELSDSMLRFVKLNFGSKSASLKKADSYQVSNMSGKEFQKLFLNVVTEVMVKKSQLSQKIVKQALDGKNLVTIDDFKEIVTICRPNTVKEYQNALEKLGYTVKGDKKTLKSVYETAKKAGLFAEIA